MKHGQLHLYEGIMPGKNNGGNLLSRVAGLPIGAAFLVKHGTNFDLFRVEASGEFSFRQTNNGWVKVDPANIQGEFFTVCHPAADKPPSLSSSTNGKGL